MELYMKIYKYLQNYAMKTESVIVSVFFFLYNNIINVEYASHKVIL